MSQLLPCQYHTHVGFAAAWDSVYICCVLCFVSCGREQLPLAGALAQAVKCGLLFTHLAIAESDVRLTWEVETWSPRS